MSRKIVDVVVVGCGLPKKGMGWYHATQMMQGLCPSARVTDIVEPFYWGMGKSQPEAQPFKEFAEKYEGKIKFHESLDSVELVLDDPKVALIAGRANQNPGFLMQAIDKGISHIFLEKPGAPSVDEMERMAERAREKGVPVYMGYNKNVAKYAQDARNFEAQNPGSVTTYIHNNAFAPEDLPECFCRNQEGMLKNMAVHELALAVTFYGVTSENIKTIDVDKAFSKVQSLQFENQTWTDFAKVGFTITTTEGRQVTIKADRCGGNNSVAEVYGPSGDLLFSSSLPDADLEAKVAQQQKDDPEMMPYFFLQHDDYIALKERVCYSVLTGGTPEGVASLDVAIETLKVAEKLKPILMNELCS